MPAALSAWLFPLAASLAARCGVRLGARTCPHRALLRARAATLASDPSFAAGGRRAGCRAPRSGETRHLFQKQMRRPAGPAGAWIAGSPSVRGTSRPRALGGAECGPPAPRGAMYPAGPSAASPHRQGEPESQAPAGPCRTRPCADQTPGAQQRTNKRSSRSQAPSRKTMQLLVCPRVERAFRLPCTPAVSHLLRAAEESLTPRRPARP